MVRNSRWFEMQNMYFQEGKINLSKIGRFGYKFDTLETNWGEFELKMWRFVCSQILIYFLVSFPFLQILVFKHLNAH